MSGMEPLLLIPTAGMLIRSGGLSPIKGLLRLTGVMKVKQGYGHFAWFDPWKMWIPDCDEASWNWENGKGPL